MANFLAPIINGQQFDANGDPLNSGEIYVYLAGSSTPATTYTTQAGGVANTFPIDLNTLGVNEDGEIWLIGGATYKFVIKDAAGVTLRTLDNMSGINDNTVTADQWIVYQGTPTYVSGTSFTVAGDQTQTFQTGRRLKTTNTGGAVYSTILSSTYSSPNTTVVVNNDSGALDSGLSVVAYGVITPASTSFPPSLGHQYPNLWDNPDCSIWQRAVASVADGNYGFDRIVNLCDTGSTTLSQLAQPTDGIPFAMRITQPDAGAKRFGFAQIVEARDCIAYRGQNIAFALKVRCSASTTIRCALVAWTSTADSPTRDVVNTWSSTNYTAGNFFVANTSPIAVGATAVTAATWTDLLVSSTSTGGVVAPSTMNNLYMVVWTDSTQAQNVTLDASIIRCGQGTVAPLWSPPDFQNELNKCKRFFQMSYPQGTAPGAASLNGNNGRAIGIDVNTTIIFAPYELEMRSSPVITTYQPVTGVVATIRSVGGASISIAGPNSIGTKGVGITYTSAGLFTAGTIYDFNWTATADL